MPTAKAQISFRVPIKFDKKKEGYVVSCPILDVVTMGRTKKEAKANIVDALILFVQGCLDHGTLSAVLEECGFRTYKTPPRKVSILPPRKHEFDFVDIPVPLHILPQRCPTECHA